MHSLSQRHSWEWEERVQGGWVRCTREQRGVPPEVARTRGQALRRLPHISAEGLFSRRCRVNSRRDPCVPGGTNTHWLWVTFLPDFTGLGLQGLVAQSLEEWVCMMGAGLGRRGVPCVCQGPMCGQMPRHLGGGSKTHHLMPQDLWRGIFLSFITSWSF